jgi:hypothetical protein
MPGANFLTSSGQSTTEGRRSLSNARAVAAVIPVPVYERLVAERQTRFEVIERVRSRAPKASLEEIEADVRQAVAKVRSRRAAGRS